MNHRTAAVLALVAALVVGGCAGGDADTPGTAKGTTEIVVVLAKGKVVPPTHRVKVDRGTKVRLDITTDTDDELHVHGYDIEKELPGGEKTTVTFTADQTGVFEIETHESELQLVQLEVR